MVHHINLQLCADDVAWKEMHRYHGRWEHATGSVRLAWVWRWICRQLSENGNTYLYKHVGAPGQLQVDL
jgi:hypothetical protein